MKNNKQYKQYISLSDISVIPIWQILSKSYTCHIKETIKNKPNTLMKV